MPFLLDRGKAAVYASRDGFRNRRFLVAFPDESASYFPGTFFASRVDCLCVVVGPRLCPAHPQLADRSSESRGLRTARGLVYTFRGESARH